MVRTRHCATPGIVSPRRQPAAAFHVLSIPPCVCSHLLQAVTSKTFVVSLMCEFIGVMVFTFLGSTVSDKVGLLLVAADVYSGPTPAPC